MPAIGKLAASTKLKLLGFKAVVEAVESAYSAILPRCDSGSMANTSSPILRFLTAGPREMIVPDRSWPIFQG